MTTRAFTNLVCGEDVIDRILENIRSKAGQRHQDGSRVEHKVDAGLEDCIAADVGHLFFPDVVDSLHESFLLRVELDDLDAVEDLVHGADATILGFHLGTLEPGNGTINEY